MPPSSTIPIPVLPADTHFRSRFEELYRRAGHTLEFRLQEALVRRRARELGITPSAVSNPTRQNGPEYFYIVPPDDGEITQLADNSASQVSLLNESPFALRPRPRSHSRRPAHIAIQESALPPGERISSISRRNRSLWLGLSSRSVSPSTSPSPTTTQPSRATTGARTRIPRHLRRRVDREVSEVFRGTRRSEVLKGCLKGWKQRISTRVRCEYDYNSLMEQIEPLTCLGKKEEELELQIQMLLASLRNRRLTLQHLGLAVLEFKARDLMELFELWIQVAVGQEREGAERSFGTVCHQQVRKLGKGNGSKCWGS
ncbi:hypothetical protein B0T09DRAFT_391261 [Sordaria sp. MPI-SDFR-AT-0083]|nr:hypothetical protein B0T09DRAFT_391261 [Sordaria sp. MPI-SDFR-AT-0083]